MKLEIKHLAPYLPYKLKIRRSFHSHGDGKLTFEYTSMIGLSLDKYNDIRVHCLFNGYSDNVNKNKPILRPLSDLTKQIEVNGEKFVPIEWFEIGDDNNESFEYDFGNIKLIKTLIDLSKNKYVYDINFLPFGVVEKLFEWHFDVFNLIEQNLVIDINTLK